MPILSHISGNLLDNQSDEVNMIFANRLMTYAFHYATIEQWECAAERFIDAKEPMDKVLVAQMFFYQVTH